jgi:hypothetical protein
MSYVATLADGSNLPSFISLKQSDGVEGRFTIESTDNSHNGTYTINIHAVLTGGLMTFTSSDVTFTITVETGVPKALYFEVMNSAPMYSEELVVQVEMLSNETLIYKFPSIVDSENDIVTVEYMLGFAKGFTEPTDT